MKAHFEMFAAYNAWANRRLYDAAAGMTDAARKAPAGAFFGTLHNTLNHLLVGDRIWMSRFDGQGPVPRSVDEVPFDDFDALRAARGEMDDRIAGHVAGLTEESLAGALTFTTIVSPATRTMGLAPALAHFFNHQTHHRGQCHHMLTAAGLDAPSLDLLVWQRDEGRT